jgi:crotonobetainyl-CoA:carnitine CoA-transferase CaiB-like acyl-CoA transferase
MWQVLTGVRILDLSRVFAGPAATQILGDLGADVIKVEDPGRGDEARYFGVTRDALEQHAGVSPSFVALNRNKRSIAIDLASPAGRRVALRMASGCDVVVHNFRPGAMKKFGLAYDDLRAARSDIILCEFSAYGDEGPLAHIGANDLALQAHSGLMSITGEPGRPPVRCGTSIVDLHASLALVIAVMAALMHRERTGEGQVVDTSLLRSSAHLMNYFYGEYWAKGVIRKAMGTANHLSVPNQVFPTADGSVVIIAPSDEMWHRCAAALDREILDRPEWNTILDRQRHRAEVIEAITGVTLSMTSDEIMHRLGSAKVNVAKVNDIGQAADHPQLVAVGGVIGLAIDGREVKAVSSPFALHGVARSADRPPPRLAEHTDEVLGELGFAQGEIAALRDEGAFGKPGAPGRARAVFTNP